jgi:hypothetical protein
VPSVISVSCSEVVVIPVWRGYSCPRPLPWN